MNVNKKLVVGAGMVGVLSLTLAVGIHRLKTRQRQQKKEWRVIGLLGKKGSGKDTAGQFLVQLGVVDQTAAFAEPLKKCLRPLCLFTNKQLYDQDHKEAVDPVWNFTPRQAMQEMGSLLRYSSLFGPELLVDNMGMHLQLLRGQNKRVVITDVRTKAEARLIQNFGGVIVRIIRTGKPEDEKAEDQCEEQPAEDDTKQDQPEKEEENQPTEDQAAKGKEAASADETEGSVVLVEEETKATGRNEEVKEKGRNNEG